MAYKRRGKKNSPKRRRRARRNPIPGGGLMINPRRRRKSYSMNKRHRRRSYLSNPRRHYRRARRNPAFLGVALPPFSMIAWGAGGFVGTPMVERFLTPFLPAEITTNVLGRYALKIGSLLGLTYLVKAVLSPKEAFPIALGGSLYVVTSAINEFLPQLTQAPAPTTTTGTAAYRSGMIKSYRSGMIATGIGSYANTGLAARAALPGLAQPSQMMPRFDIDSSGMKNPVFADPRFATGVAR